MAYCNAKTILDKALTKICASDLRDKALVWLNESIRDVLNQPRSWKFLEALAVLSISDSKVTLPEAVSEIVYFKIGDTMYTPADLLSDVLAKQGKAGYTIDPDRKVTFYPTAVGTALLKYEADLTTDVTDSTTPMIFPAVFENLFIVGVRKDCYDYEKDGRYTKEEIKYAGEMSKVKSWDNRMKPLPGYDDPPLYSINGGIFSSAGGSGGGITTPEDLVYTDIITGIQYRFYVENGVWTQVEV